MKNGLQNGAKIDAKIIQCRFWAAKGAPTVDLECFLGGFEKLYNFQSSLDAQKGLKIDRCGTQGGEGGAKGWRSGMGGWWWWYFYASGASKCQVIDVLMLKTIK